MVVSLDVRFGAESTFRGNFYHNHQVGSRERYGTQRKGSEWASGMSERRDPTPLHSIKATASGSWSSQGKETSSWNFNPDQGAVSRASAP